MSRKTCFWGSKGQTVFGEWKILSNGENRKRFSRIAERAAREGPGKSQFGRIAAALARKRCSETQSNMGLRLGKVRSAKSDFITLWQMSYGHIDTVSIRYLVMQVPNVVADTKKQVRNDGITLCYSQHFNLI